MYKINKFESVDVYLFIDFMIFPIIQVA